MERYKKFMIKKQTTSNIIYKAPMYNNDAIQNKNKQLNK